MSECDTQPNKPFYPITAIEINEKIANAPIEQLNIDDLVFNKKEYCRVDGIDRQAVDDYSQNLASMPPIIVAAGIDGKYVIVNGVHRYQALLKKDQKTAPVKIIDIPETSAPYAGLLLDLSFGVRHPQKDIKEMCVRLFDGEVENSKLVMEQLKIPKTTYYDYVSDSLNKYQEIIYRNIIQEYLPSGVIQETIAERYNYNRSRISQIINDVMLIIPELGKINIECNDEDRDKIQEEIKAKLKEKNLSFLSDVCTFKPELYNVWYSHKMDHATTHFGAFPEWMMSNLLYYYTQPFDLVYDPFAGGGTTIDVCKKMIRRYYCSDRKPIGERKDEIKEWDINDGIPYDLPKPDFVFLDPPYWVQARGKYSEDGECLGNMDLKSFYSSLSHFMKNLADKKVKRMALVIQPTQYSNVDHAWEDHIFTINDSIRDRYRIAMRFIAPYSTEQYKAQHIIESKKEKFPLCRHRDIVIWELL